MFLGARLGLPHSNNVMNEAEKQETQTDRWAHTPDKHMQAYPKVLVKKYN